MSEDYIQMILPVCIVVVKVFCMHSCVEGVLSESFNFDQ